MVTLDASNGFVEPTGDSPIFVNTGNGDDGLQFVGDNAAFLRVITGLITPQATSSSIRRVSVNGDARTYFLTNLENLQISKVGTLDFLSRNGEDAINLAPVAGGGQITGTSGTVAGTPQPFLPTSWESTQTLSIFTANSDLASTRNLVTVASGSLQTAGLKNFIFSGSPGLDTLDMQASDLKLPVADGQVLFNGNGSNADTLIVTGDTNFTLNDFKLTPGSGGFVRPVNVERIAILGGAGANTINAAASTKSLLLDGRGGNDTLIGGTNRNILIGGIAADNITGGADEDLLIGGTLAFAANSDAMRRAWDEWLNVDVYTSRVAHLRGASGGLNSPAFLTTSTVPDDNAIDTLRGNADDDWFFAYATDTLLDKLATELLR